MNLGEIMKRLWFFVAGFLLINLMGCQFKKELTETELFPVLNQFLTIVNEVEHYSKTERDDFIHQSLSMSQSSTQNPLFDYLKDDHESIGFTETGPFATDHSENPLNTLTIKYNFSPSSKSVSLMLAYRFNSKEVSDDFQLALQTNNLEDNAQLSTIFNLKNNLIGDVFEQIILLFSNDTEIETTELIKILQTVEISYEEHESEMKKIYSLHDGTNVLTISYDQQTKFIDLVTYDTQGFQKSLYFSDGQRILSIKMSHLSQTKFENEIYENLVTYLSEKMISE